jgi:O-antigen/teichoic acid export membrane protein
VKVENGETKNNRMATDSLLLTFVKVVTMSVGILQAMILSRTLSKVDYGTYSEGLLIISFFVPFFSLGLTDSVNYFFNKTIDSQERKRYIDTVFFLSATAGLIGGILLYIFRSSLVKFFGNETILPLIIYISFRPCLQNLIALYQPLYISNHYSKVIALRNLIVSVLQIAIVGISSIFFQDLKLIFALLLVLDVAQVIIFDSFYRRKCGRISYIHPQIPLIKNILVFAMPMLLASSIGTINLSLDKLLISNMMSVEDYALYGNVSKELPFAFVVTAFTAVVTPTIVRLISENKLQKFKQLWSDYLKMGYTITWPLCMGAFIMAPQLIEVLYSKAYLSDAGIAVFRIYTIVAMFRFTYFGLVPTAYGKTRIVLRYSIIAMMINVILNYTFFSLWGMIGPSIATVVSMLASTVMYFKTSMKLTKTKFTEIFDLKKFGGFIALMIISWLIVLLVEKITFRYIGSAFIQFIIGFGLFELIFFGIKRKEITSLIKRMNNSY